MSCSDANPSDTNHPPDGHNSQIALDWDGLYTGLLPCADCEGIKTIVTLKKNGTYTRVTRYEGKSKAIFNERGQFEWSEDGSTVLLMGSDPTTSATQYKVVENGLIQLDIEGNLIAGDLADQYRLEKQDDGVLDKHWRVEKLNGQIVSLKSNIQKLPFLTLEKENNSLSGFGGCNTFAGKYKGIDSSRIELSNIASTKMACDHLDFENEFLIALQTVFSYSSDGRTLTLLNESGEDVITCSAVYIY